MPKPTRKDTKREAESSASESDSGPEDRTPAKKVKKPDDEPEKKEWVLEKMRRVRINEYKGRKSVDIREFYETGGEVKPGKKGIALTKGQWNTLCEHMKEITDAINE